MKVLMVSEHCCTRVIKEGIALLKAGIDVAFMQKRHANPNFKPMLPNIMYYTTVNQLVEKLHSIIDVDIIHVHNEPDWLGHVCKSQRPDLPVVFDAHDLFSVRIGEKTPDEDMSFKLCDAFVYPSQRYLNHSLKCHAIENRPNIVIYSMVNQEFLCDAPLPRVNALVYEGGLRIKEREEDVPEEFQYHTYRDYRQLFFNLSKVNIPVFAFCANPDVVDEYIKTGAMLYPPVEYNYLIQSLSRFSWGLAGGPRPHPQWDAAMPNKLFEYLAAGIPIITLNASEVSEFVEKHCVGVTVKDYKEIEYVFRQLNSDYYRAIVQSKREMFTMENEINKLIELYLSII